jgi:alpha-mannosidase
MTTIDKKIVRIGKYVDTNHVDTLIRTYKQERWAQNSEKIGMDDTLNFYYTIDELQEFLETAKQAGANGVRVHFGVYPMGFQERPENAGRQTTVLVATKREEAAAAAPNAFVERNVYVNNGKGTQVLAYNMMGLPDDTMTEWGGIGVTLIDKGDSAIIV